MKKKKKKRKEKKKKRKRKNKKKKKRKKTVDEDRPCGMIGTNPTRPKPAVKNEGAKSEFKSEKTNRAVKVGKKVIFEKNNKF